MQALNQTPSIASLNFSALPHSNPRPTPRPTIHFPSPKPRRGFGLVTAAAKPDYYTTLNVDRNATLDQIKSSYRKLARKHHPDTSNTPGSEEKFKEISAAYEVLSNEDKRGLYDRFGEAGLQGEFNGPSFADEEVDPFQMFGSMFGDGNGFFGAEGISESNKNLDIWSDVSLTFEESIFGGKREIEVPCLERCTVCDGTGAKSAQCVKSCVTCEGRGRVMKSQRTPFGIVSQVSTCQSCQGGGKIVTDKCVKCGGLGNLKSKRTFSIVIPPGVDDGATMQLRGEGNTDDRRRISGDLYLVLHVKEKHGIWRDGLNLVSRVNITYVEAILGTVIKVKTVDGAKELQIPPGIQPGETVKLSHLGVPKGHGYGRGDHVFIVDVRIPKTVSDRERKLVEELASLNVSSVDYSSSINGAVGKSKMTTEKIHHSYDNSETGNSVWKSVQRLFRRRQSRNGFASATMDMAPTIWLRSKLNPPFSTSWIVMILFTCIFALVTTIIRKSFGNRISNRGSHDCRRTNR